MKIIFLAFTSKKYDGNHIKISDVSLTRKMSCMETWVPKIESLGHKVIFFDGGNDKISYNSIDKILHCVSPETYDHNPPIQGQTKSFMFERLKEAIQWVLENEQFDYIYRIDDGSYVNHYVIDKVLNELGNADVLRNRLGGQSGMFLSKKVCEKLVSYENETNQMIEDKVIFEFFAKNNFNIKYSELLCTQYVVGEKFFIIHYSNGKRQYFVEDVLDYYYRNVPIPRKVIINSDVNYWSHTPVKTWNGDGEFTPMWYAFNKDKYNWEFYGKQVRSDFNFRSFCPFGEKSLNRLVIPENGVLNTNNGKLIEEYVKSIQDNGKLIVSYNDDLFEFLQKFDFKLETINGIDLEEKSEFFNFSDKKWLVMSKEPKVSLNKIEKIKSNFNIGVCQFYTENVLYGEYSEQINRKYCEDNNYYYFVEKNSDKLRVELEGRAPTWYKPKLVLDTLKRNPDLDYLLFLDIDAIFCNNNRRIEEFIHGDFEILMTEDFGPSIVNAGVLLVKNSDFIKKLMQDWWDICEEYPHYKNALWHDQTCLKYVHDRLSDKNKFKIIPNGDLNSREYNDNKFIFHAFSYGSMPYRTIDVIYRNKFNVKIDTSSFKLTQLGEIHPTDKHYEHNYLGKVYERVFSPIKKDIKKFVEIGISDGGSLKIWSDYFVNSEIIGLDNNKDFIKTYENYERIKTILLDQSKEKELIDFSDKNTDIDVILDDGSHKMYDQQVSFATLFKSLRSGGIYIIENLHTSIEALIPEKAWCNWGDPKKTTTLQMLDEYSKTNKIVSDYMTEQDKKYLEENIKSCEVIRVKQNWSITSVIIKK
jgi:hypothetical protein